MELDALSLALLQEALAHVTIRSGKVLLSLEFRAGRPVRWEVEQKASGNLDDLQRKAKASVVD